jgi:hypothetical protein
MLKKIIAFCGGQNKYETTKVGANAHAEMTATIRTNIQGIANSNPALEQYGYMFGQWLIKRSSEYFLTGLYDALVGRDNRKYNHK